MILDVKSLDGVQSKTCLGCINHKADVMVTVRTQEDKNFIDIFFSRENAETLRDRLDAVLKLNEEEDWVSNTLDPNNDKYLASMKTAPGKTYSQTVSDHLEFLQDKRLGEPRVPPDNKNPKITVRYLKNRGYLGVYKD